MKTKIVLTVSLAANAALVAAYLVSRPGPLSAPAVTELVTNMVAERKTDRAARSPAPALTNGLITNDFAWASVESADYREYIANLRAIGCPEETIRDIIITDVNKLFGARIAALYPKGADFKFWQTEERNRAAERERERKIRELDREKRQLIKELLGIDYEDELAKWRGRPDEDEYRYGFLSQDKQQQLKAMQEKYRDLERAIFAEGGGGSPENRAKFNALRAQREAEMAQLLTPQEYEEYQLRNSWTARNMRESLSSFEPTEWEFRELFKLRKAFDDQFRFNREGGDQAAREQRRLAEQQLEQQLANLLGTERYGQYQLAQDDRFRDTYEFTQRNSLPRQTADTVYEIRRAAEAARQQVMNDPAISPEIRSATLFALAEEARKTLASTLGDSFNEYRRRAEWLERLPRIDNDRGRDERDRFSRQ